MANKAIRAGDPIESNCTRCRMLTNHIVVAVAGGVPAKVLCNTCGGEHRYRPKKEPAQPASPAKLPRKAATSKISSASQDWEELRPRLEKEIATPYQTTGAYKPGTVLNHPVFGLGLVKRSAGPQKIEVLFQEGLKIMRCQ